MTHTMRLPRDWVEAPFGDVIVLQKGKKPAHVFEEPNETTLPYIDIKAFERGKVTKHATPEGAVPVEEGTILLVWDGARSGLAGCSRVQGLLGSTLMRVEPVFVDKAYALYFLQQSYRELNTRTRGTGIPHVNPQVFSGLAFPLAPTHEQHRIVEAIESYLTRLDAAVASLERVQKSLKRYRASVLKAAVEGRLVPTEAELARKEGRSYEPASELLKRILVERRKRWIENAAEKARAKTEEKARKAGKPWTHTDDIKTLEKERTKAATKYKEPAAPDTSNLPDLPEGWSWTRLEQLSYITGGITKNSKRLTLPLQVPYLRVANVYADELRLKEIKEIGVGEDEYSRTVLETSDLLVVEGNGSIEQIGRVALWNGSISGCCHQNHLIKARLVVRELARWVLMWLLSTAGRAQIMRVASSTSGLHTLNISKVSALPIPLPPQAEARRLVLKIDQVLSLANASAGLLKNSAARSSRLRQSVLKWAFEGKLVEQDPNDEPASVLLERIKAERESMQPRKRRRTGKRKNVNMVKHDGQLDLLEGSNT